jgi:hypothetical protein
VHPNYIYKKQANPVEQMDDEELYIIKSNEKNNKKKLEGK